MTSESTWHWVWMGAKLTLGAAVLAGVVAFLSLPVSAVPIPAGLLLFLSGLAGIGFLGRYKAKRNEPAVSPDEVITTS